MYKSSVFLSLFILFSFSSILKAQNLPKANIDSKGLWVDGYDIVAYFTEKKAVKGKKEFAIKHEGATYWFSTEKNKELFKNSPSTYQAEYGGWCAYAMGKDGTKVEVDPKTFKLKDGKLYLFYNQYFTNTLPEWNKDEAKLKKMADENWVKQKHKPL